MAAGPLRDHAQGCSAAAFLPQALPFDDTVGDGIATQSVGSMDSTRNFVSLPSECRPWFVHRIASCNGRPPPRRVPSWAAARRRRPDPSGYSTFVTLALDLAHRCGGLEGVGRYIRLFPERFRTGGPKTELHL